MIRRENMKIKWNGHASFTITADDGTVIVTDPYDPGGYGGVLTYDMVTDKADAVLVSHDHADHNYVKGLPGSPQVIKGSGQVKDIRVKGIEMYHDKSGGSERGPNTVFVLTVDGIHICFVGDLGHSLSQEQLQAVGPVDLLLIPVGGTFTLDARGAAEVAETIGPKIVIPMHFKTEKCTLPITSVDEFIAEMKNVKKLNASEADISQKTLPTSGLEVWVLNYAC
jgi:L-ascorbate metabolism protein UlaG (beta-lactamase superfamily)